MSVLFVTEEDIRQSVVTAVGSRLIEKKAEVGGVPTLIFNTAIRMTVEELRPDYEGVNGYAFLDEKYRSLGTHVGEYFFNFEQADTVNDYGVFSFHAAEGWKSLRDAKAPLSSDTALEIFRRLVDFLWEYNNCAYTRKGYRPLLFICRDSVYTKVNSKGELQICMLPMPYDACTQYPGMPREVFERQGDVSADVYMAAYLYLQLKYPDGQPFAEDEYAKYDLLAERCLSPFLQRRPSLEELVTQLATEEKKQAPNPAPAPVPKPTPQPSPAGAFSVINPTPMPRPKPPRKHRRPAWLESILRKQRAGVAKMKRAAGKLSDAQDMFDGVLSTTQGDSEENDT